MKTGLFMSFSMVLLALSMIGGFAGAVAAQDELGAELSELWCSACHVTGAVSGESATDTAPTFSSLSPLARSAPDRFRAFLSEPHNEAMQGISLSREEIESLILYIQRAAPDPYAE